MKQQLKYLNTYQNYTTKLNEGLVNNSIDKIHEICDAVTQTLDAFFKNMNSNKDLLLSSDNHLDYLMAYYGDYKIHNGYMRWSSGSDVYVYFKINNIEIKLRFDILDDYKSKPTIDDIDIRKKNNAKGSYHYVSKEIKLYHIFNLKKIIDNYQDKNYMDILYSIINDTLSHELYHYFEHNETGLKNIDFIERPPVETDYYESSREVKAHAFQFVYGLLTQDLSKDTIKDIIRLGYYKKLPSLYDKIRNPNIKYFIHENIYSKIKGNFKGKYLKEFFKYCFMFLDEYDSEKIKPVVINFGKEFIDKYNEIINDEIKKIERHIFNKKNGIERIYVKKDEQIDKYYDTLYVNKYIEIINNKIITNITGFNKLTGVGNDLSIEGNSKLTNITGFNNLTWVGGLSISGNQYLTEVTGFTNLTQVSGTLWIKNNKSLTEVTGFNKLIWVGGWLSIYDNESLTKVTGFEKLTLLGGWLSIVGNKSLTEVTGFTNLTQVGGCLSIYGNKSLTEVTGFTNLTEIGDNLFIRNNPKLVAMSIPGNLLRSVNYSKNRGIMYDNNLEFTSPPEFINSPVVINNLVTKFNPGDHSTQVVKQIIENVEEWGTEETKEKVYEIIKHNQQ